MINLRINEILDKKEEAKTFVHERYTTLAP